MRALLAGHLREQVGEVVVLHLVEHAHQPVEIEPFDDAQLLGLGQLFEQVGEALVLHRLGQLLALRHRQGAHDVGDVARMHVAHARGLGRHRRAAAEQAGHFVPVDEPVARPAAESVAAGEAYLGELPVGDAAVGGAAQGDVADGLVADFLVEHVAPDEQLARLGLERVEIDVPAAQARAVAVDRAEPGAVDEDAPALAGGDVSDDTWRGAGARGHDHDVFDATD